ncbi:acetolactate synthase catalytic subunit [Bordetella bronchiseptica B18-5 (C3)]|uniref:acetolactate synthase catalytic subunit n=1 Tax=Bordetella bronchiseptica TaxID=518 RepID=UPI0004615F77|nr:acetolactate synthase catalytic subunit [Bordetella bronchiseptica]KDB59602.1 acetolactate synthase catalytic subunit [Bordetella bronchiseptica B18-5 (C3)]KDD87328.1 acetolactate synthase catalytic subunit [Bordetella bronchiseptica MBORD762]
MQAHTESPPGARTSTGSWARQDLSTYQAANAIADVLKAAGVAQIFGQSCPTALFLAADAIGIRQIGYRTENAGAAMADGAARVGRQLTVITAQNGPAAALLVAGFSEATKASVPILAIVQEVPRANADKNAFQELDHVQLFASCAKWVRRIDVAERAAEYTERAIRIATSGRPGPVVLLVSQDVLTTACPQARPVAQDSDEPLGRFPLDRTVPVAGRLAQLAQRLLDAKRPLVVAGGGVHLSGACDALARLQSLAGLPVATTNMGKGAIDETHPLSLGVIGNAMGTRSPAKHFMDYVRSADFVLFVGTRTNENGTASWSLFPEQAQYAQIDIDSEEVGRNYGAMRFAGDAAATLQALGDALQGRGQAVAARRMAELAPAFEACRQAHRAELAPYAQSDASPMRPERIMAELRASHGDIIWVADASYSSIWLAQFIPCTEAGTRFVTPRGIAGLGWGVPMAIGAKIARPGARVICLTGDGGFAHCWAELETARRHEVPLTIVVLNNGVLGFQINAEESRFGTHTDVCHFGAIDHVAIAKACGCDGASVSDAASLRQAMAAAERSPVPFVIDVKTEPSAFPPISAFESQLRPLGGETP